MDSQNMRHLESEEASQLEDAISCLALEQVEDRPGFLGRRRARSLPLWKRVKFADALGLSLASVHHFNTAEIPQGPPVLAQHEPPPARALLVPTFLPAPAARLQHCQVALEQVTVTQYDVRGQVRALTCDCSSKQVGVRYTFNDWLSYLDVDAVPEPAQVDNECEHFSFTLLTPPLTGSGGSVHFAVFCRTERGEFWDNNEGRNYTLRQRGSPDGAN